MQLIADSLSSFVLTVMLFMQFGSVHKVSTHTAHSAEIVACGCLVIR